MVDVHVGVRRPPHVHEVEELLERLLLIGERVRPQRRVLVIIVDPAEQVVDAPVRVAVGGRLGVERVTLEIEEDVTAARSRQRVNGFWMVGVVRRLVVGFGAQLQPRLRS